MKKLICITTLMLSMLLVWVPANAEQEVETKSPERKQVTPSVPASVERSLTNSHVFWLSVTSVICFAAVLCTSVVVLRNNEKALTALFKHDSTILRVLTVLFIIWAATGLAMTGAFTEGISTLFAGIVGYVLGSIKGDKPSPET